MSEAVVPTNLKVESEPAVKVLLLINGRERPVPDPVKVKVYPEEAKPKVSSAPIFNFVALAEEAKVTVLVVPSIITVPIF